MQLRVRTFHKHNSVKYSFNKKKIVQLNYYETVCSRLTKASLWSVSSRESLAWNGCGWGVTVEAYDILEIRPESGIFVNILDNRNPKAVWGGLGIWTPLSSQ